MNYRVLALCALTLSGGCQLLPARQLPTTLGEDAAAFGYVPLDGLAVDQVGMADSCKGEKKTFLPLLQSLPDITSRFSVADVQANGSLTFGPAKVSGSQKVYRAVLDFVNVDAVPEVFYIRAHVSGASGIAYQPITYSPKDNEEIVGYEVFSKRSVEANPDILETDGTKASSLPPSASTQQLALIGAARAKDGNFSEVTIPIYVGIGMRLTADVMALEGGVALTSLAQIGAAAEAKQIVGTLTVQTIGVNGKGIATALPLPSKIDQTTIENGLLAMGSIRTQIFGALSTPAAPAPAAPAGASPATPSPPAPSVSPDLTLSPRVVGLFSPIGTEPALINAIYSELASRRPQWPRVCGP